MSLKVKTFTSIITNPLNIHNFVVDIPGFDYSMLVASTVFPSEKLREVILHYQGEEIHYPTIPNNTHHWDVRLPENDDGKVRTALETIKARYYSQTAGTFTPQTWLNVPVYARDLNNNEVFHTILHGAWLQGRDDVQLDNSDPSKNWNWQYRFVFQWIEDGAD